MNSTLNLPHPAEVLLLSKLSSDIKERMSRVRLMIFDVDGVLTDGTLWYSRHGEVVKGFNARDGHGLKLLRESGIIVALMTGRDTQQVTRRALDLGITEVLQGVSNKGEAILELSQKYGVDLDAIGFMGDDLIDIPAMSRAGFAATVADAPSYISQASHWVSQQPGGKGAARECCDLILASQGKLARFITTGSGHLLTSGSSQ